MDPNMYGMQQQYYSPYNQMGISGFPNQMDTMYGYNQNQGYGMGYGSGYGYKQHNPHLAQKKFKTALCRHFKMSGSCSLGTNCSFAHGEEELR